MTETTTVVVPLWAAVVAALSVLGSTIGGTIWVMQTFQTKAEAQRDKQDLENSIEEVQEGVRSKANDIESRQNKMEPIVSKVAQDVSYIRGRLEKGVRYGD